MKSITAPGILKLRTSNRFKAGEHPRLLFRAKDVPALRERMKTPEGQAIVQRLRDLLGENGEAMTSQFSPFGPRNIRIMTPEEKEERDAGNRQIPDMPIGTFTSWHAAGFGFLYQLTGEQKYADLAKESVELMLAGKFDRDPRYSWISGGTTMRASNVLGAMAYAYDFCYNAWPEDFRQKIALEIQNYDKPTATDMSGWNKEKGQSRRRRRRIH